ncbi:MAG: hypothetical protein ABI706_11310 [Ilumatobacteraceae bacterium]
MSALAHVLEAHGIATVGISLIRAQAECAKAPRMLHCEFPLGRPLGRPGDPAFQHRVLAAAFALLPRIDVPVLVDFDETIVDEADQPLACSLPPRHDPSLHPAVDEALGLRAAYERRRAATGRTNVVRLGGAARIPELVSAFLRIVDGEAWDAVGLAAEQLGQAALDIRAYYEEAAVELAEHVPAARQAESWFYRGTECGALLRNAQQIIRAADAPRPAWFPLVPVGQQPS